MKRLFRKFRERTNKIDVLNLHERSLPDRQHEFDLFKGEWSSHLPSYDGGASHLFDDSRIKWLDEISGGVDGKTVLELGPLEGGHTSMLARRGAKVTAIESNRRAFLKCLIVKNAFNFDADFRLGDFTKYIAATTDRYDILLASGVLYHMTDPISVLRDMAKLSDVIFLWTHYYDENVILPSEKLRKKFSLTPRGQNINGKNVSLFKYHYLGALNWRGFSGGTQHYSNWLSKDGLMTVLSSLGFKVEIGDDDSNHVNGPCILLYAKK